MHTISDKCVIINERFVKLYGKDAIIVISARYGKLILSIENLDKSRLELFCFSIINVIYNVADNGLYSLQSIFNADIDNILFFTKNYIAYAFGVVSLEIIDKYLPIIENNDKSAILESKQLFKSLIEYLNNIRLHIGDSNHNVTLIYSLINYLYMIFNIGGVLPALNYCGRCRKVLDYKDRVFFSYYVAQFICYQCSVFIDVIALYNKMFLFFMKGLHYINGFDYSKYYLDKYNCRVILSILRVFVVRYLNLEIKAFDGLIECF